MGYWKSKVLPKIKKVFEKTGTKKEAAEACKSFDDSKEEINKELEDKKTELQPKIIEIYEASPAEIKILVKDPKEAGLKKHSAAAHNFVEELAKIEFPGSQTVFEASSKYGASLMAGPLLFIFEKVSTLVVVEEAAVNEEDSSSKGKEQEILVMEEDHQKKLEVVEEKASVVDKA